MQLSSPQAAPCRKSKDLWGSPPQEIQIWGSSTGSKDRTQCRHHTVAALAPELPPRPSTAAELPVHPQTAPSGSSPRSSQSLLHSQQDHSMIPSQLFFSRPGTTPGVKHPPGAPHTCSPTQPTALEMEIPITTITGLSHRNSEQLMTGTSSTSPGLLTVPTTSQPSALLA